MNPEGGQIVALLPIKAHSERVQGKNFRNFAGKPLFRWILETLLSVDIVSKVVINTDARNILESHGLRESDKVIIRDRREALRGDLVSMNRIIEDDVKAVEAELYLMTHTTNPLLSADSIRKAVQTYREAVLAGKDSLFSVNKHQTRFYRGDSSPVNHNPDNLVRTQDLEPWYEENSNLYLFSRVSFALTKARIGKNPVLFETPHMESVDIDDEVGWTVAEIFALSKQIYQTHSNFQE